MASAGDPYVPRPDASGRRARRCRRSRTPRRKRAKSARPISTAANWRCGRARRTRQRAYSGWRRATAQKTSTSGAQPMRNSRRLALHVEQRGRFGARPLNIVLTAALQNSIPRWVERCGPTRPSRSPLSVVSPIASRILRRSERSHVPGRDICCCDQAPKTNRVPTSE